MPSSAAIGFDWAGRRYTIDAPCRVPERCLPDDIVRWALYGLRWLSVAAQAANTPERSAQVSRLAQQLSDFVTRGTNETGMFEGGALWPDRAIGAVISAAHLAAEYAEAWHGRDIPDPGLPVDEMTRSIADRWGFWWDEFKKKAGGAAKDWATGSGLDIGILILIAAWLYLSATKRGRAWL